MRRSPALRRIIPAIAVGALVLAACGSDDDSTDGADDTTASADTTGTTDAADAAGEGDCSATIEDGVLTIATGEPAFFPWVLDDTPESGEGFEAAVAYAVAAEMGYEGDAVVWTRTTFDEAIQPGAKSFDMISSSTRSPRSVPRTSTSRFRTSLRTRRSLHSRARRPKAYHDCRAPGRQVRRPGRHHQPGVHHRRHPADTGAVRLRRQRGRQGRARGESDRRCRLRPPDGAVRVRCGNRGKHRHRPVPRRRRRDHRPVRLRAREGQRAHLVRRCRDHHLTDNGELDAITQEWLADFTGAPVITVE